MNKLVILVILIIMGFNYSGKTQSVDYPGAIARWVPSCNTGGTRSNSAIDTWVNHWIGVGTYLGSIDWFLKCPGSGSGQRGYISGTNTLYGASSAHFIINTNGEVTQLVPVNIIAYHAGATGYNNNTRSIGVEHAVTASDPSKWNNTVLLQASVNLASYFCNIFNIPKVYALPGIRGHKDMPGTSTECPGPLPWTTWMNMLSGGGTNPPSNDNCSGAIMLTPNTACSKTSGDIAGATQSYAASGCSSGLIQDVWYKFTATSNGTYTIKLTPSSSMDGVVEVRQGGCTGTVLGCKDSGGGNGGIENLDVAGTNGTTYYVRVYEYNSVGNTTPPASTTFDICVTSPSSSNCTISSFSPSSITRNPESFSSSSGDDIIVNGQPNCSFSVSESCSWLAITPTSGTTNSVGQTFLNYTIQANTSSSARSCTVSVNGSPFTITQNGCTFDFSPTTKSVSASGATYNLDIDSYSPCSWSIQNSCSWVHLSQTSGTGYPTISVTVDPNTTNSSRSYTLTMSPGNSTHTITQPGSCTPPTSPTSATADQTTITSGQSTTLQVVGGALNSAPNWVWYTSSCGGTQIGTGATLVVSPTATTTYYVQASACGTTTACKSVTITVNDNNTCTSPIASVNSPSGSGSATIVCTASGGSGGTIQYKWYSGTSCSGTVLGTSSSLVVTSSGSYSCKAYISGAETTCYTCATGYVTINATTCTNWAITPLAQSVPSTGGSYQASVSASGSCSYNLTVNDSWIHFVNPDGNGGFNYSVDANTSSNSRTGTISINNVTDQINNIVTLTVTQAGSTNYTISLSSNPTAGGTTSGGGTFQGGLLKTVIANPASGYTFSNWTENGSVVSTNASYTFTLNANRTLVANFIQNTPNYTISLSSNPSAGGTTSGGGTYQGGQSRTVVATPNSGYTFTNWTENGSVVSTSTSYTFTLNANRALVANFTQQLTSCTNWAVTPSAQSVPSNGGSYQASVSASGSCSYNLTVNDSWIHFVNYDGNGGFNYSVDANISSNSRTGTISINNLTDQINNIVTLTVTQAGSTNYTVALSSNPSAGGTTSGAGTFAAGQSKTVVATANTGYTFSNWTENGSVVSTSASYTFTLNANRTLVANFTQNTVNYTISLSSNPTAGGTTSGAGTFAAGQSKTVVATANTGYTFSNWTENGSVVSTNASYMFTLNANRTLVANFTTQLTCTNWAVTPSSQSVPSTGGSYQATVSVSGTCSHSRTFNDTWIHFSSSDGNGSFTYTVDPNTSSTSRTGTISINNATDVVNNVVTLTITQAGTTCSIPASVVVTGGGEYCGNATIKASGGEGGIIYWQGTTYNGTNLDTQSSVQTVKLSGTYYFRAYNSCGWGQQGSVTVIISQSVTPSVSIVASPAATISPGQLVTFTASSVNGGSSPGYQWNINGVIVGDNKPQFSSSTLLDGQVVSCKMTSNDPCSNPTIVSSNEITMKVSFPVENEVIPLNNNIKVYPNPTTGIINIEGLSDNKKNKIEVFDSIGKKILSKTSSTSMETLDISNYPSGFYLLKIDDQFIKISKQ